jgi:hypothetical protein
MIAAVSLQAMNPFRTGKLVLWQVAYDRNWHDFEVWCFVLIGLMGVRPPSLTWRWAEWLGNLWSRISENEYESSILEKAFLG